MGTGPLVYYTVYWVESVTIVSLSLLFAGGATLSHESQKPKPTEKS